MIGFETIVDSLVKSSLVTFRDDRVRDVFDYFAYQIPSCSVVVFRDADLFSDTKSDQPTGLCFLGFVRNASIMNKHVARRFRFGNAAQYFSLFDGQ